MAKKQIPEWQKAHQARLRTDAEYREKCAKQRKELKKLRDTDPKKCKEECDKIRKSHESLN